MSTIVEAECLTKRFGDLTAIDSISFSLEVGKIYGLLGVALRKLSPGAG